MPMTDPMNALRSLESAIATGVVSLDRCDVHKSLGVHLDNPTGRPRFTYAIVKGRTVKAIAIFALMDPIDGTHCFHIGYAVAETERRNGLGSKILSQAIDELRNGLSRTPMKTFYLEAVVSTSNVASNKIAKSLISDSYKEITDSISGEQAFQYLRKVECGA